MKQIYHVPSIKVVSFKVEEGFTATKQDVSVGDKLSTTPTDGTEGFFTRSLTQS